MIQNSTTVYEQTCFTVLYSQCTNMKWKTSTTSTQPPIPRCIQASWETTHSHSFSSFQPPWHLPSEGDRYAAVLLAHEDVICYCYCYYCCFIKLIVAFPSVADCISLTMAYTTFPPHNIVYWALTLNVFQMIRIPVDFYNTWNYQVGWVGGVKLYLLIQCHIVRGSVKWLVWFTVLWTYPRLLRPLYAPHLSL